MLKKYNFNFLLIGFFLIAGHSFAQENITLKGNELFGSLSARQIGPAVMSGRITDIAGHPSNNRIIYAGTAGGGVWKSTNGGATFKSIFDDYNQSVGIIDNWLRHIKDEYRLHDKYLNSIENEEERFNAFVEINAKEQVYNLAKTSIVQGAWKNGQDLMLHGWVYGLNSGFVTDLNVNIASNEELDEVYQLKF